MAMKDNVSIPVSPEMVDETITLFQSFGWENKGQTETRTNDSQIKTGQDEEYEYYTTIRGEHTFTLFFERDRGRPNYEELKALESEYYAIKDSACPTVPPLFTKFWLIVTGIGLLFYVIPGIIILVVRIKKHSDGKKAFDVLYPKWKEEVAANDAKRAEILAKAQALV